MSHHLVARHQAGTRDAGALEPTTKLGAREIQEQRSNDRRVHEKALIDDWLRSEFKKSKK